MTYDKENDVYICNNKKLNFTGTTTRKLKSGYVANIKIYECESWSDCPIKEKCTKAKGNKKYKYNLYLSKKD